MSGDDRETDRLDADHKPAGDSASSRRTGPTVEELRDSIEALLASGKPLPSERQLSEDLDAPRSRVRRVLVELRSTGTLPPAQVGRRASRETPPKVNELARIANPTDVIELRLILEPQLARLAAIRASALQTSRIVRAATSSPDAGYGAADLSFHLEVASGSRNALAHELYGLLRQVGADGRVRLASRRGPCEERRKARDLEHMRIAKAIAGRDPEGAEEAMRSHLLKVQALILERLSPEPADSPRAQIMGAAE